MEDTEENENIILQYLVFIISTIALSIAAMFFILRVAEGASFNERIYAKNLALLIDDAKPNTIIFLDMKKGAEIAEKSNFEPKVGILKNKIIVQLAPTKKGFETYDTFFREVNVEAKYLNRTHKIQLTISEKENTQ